MTTETAAADTLRGKVARGLRWKIASQVVAQGSRTLVGILLAHILTPRDFGVAAMALAFTSVAGIFTDLSLGSALVQRRTITEQDRSTVFWTTLATGASMTLLGIAVAPLAGRFFHNEDVVPLFMATSALASISALSTTQMALLTREMNFRGLELREIASTVVGCGAAICLALAGFGPWSIVGQSLVTAGVSCWLVWTLSSWRPRRTFSRTSLMTLGSFGVKTLFSRILGYLQLNADNLLVGRYLGSAALGVYSIAFNLMFLPIGRIALPIQQVMFAAFVRLQDEPRRLGQSWLRGTQLSAAVTVPAFLGMAIVAPDFVPSVLGAKWHASVPVLQLLSVAGAVHAFQTLNWSVLQAVGRPGLLLRFMVFSTVLLVGGFAVGLHWGVVGVAAVTAFTRTAVVVCYAAVTSRALRMPVSSFVSHAASVFSLAVPMAIGVFVVRIGLVHAGVGPGARLAVLVPLGACLYGAGIAWRGRDLASDASAILLRRGGA